MATSYISQINQLKLEVQDVNGKILLRVKGISSRFQKRKHTVYLLIANPVFDFTPEDFSKIKGYCTCKSGSRTIGGCAHVVSTLMLFLQANNNAEPEQSKAQMSFSSVRDITTASSAPSNELLFSIDDIHSDDDEVESIWVEGNIRGLQV